MTEGLNATPFIVAAYGIVSVSIIGYAAYLIAQRRKLKKILNLISGDKV